MKEKLTLVENICGFLGIAILFVYIVLAIVGGTVIIQGVKIILAALALIAFAIRCGAEIMCEENCYWSSMMIGLCLYDIAYSMLQLM